MLLTANELQFMSVLWNANTPLTSSEILERSINRTWKDTSLHTILSKLLIKGAIAEHGFIKEGKSISRTFVPVLSVEDYYAESIACYSAKDIPSIFCALIRKDDINLDTIEKLEALIQKRRLELEGNGNK